MYSKKSIEYDEALNKLEAYCVAAERCIEDINRKMNNWELTNEEKNKILNALIENRFLDEIRYAKAYVNDKYKFAKWGRKKIVQNMMMKGVDREAIQEGINHIDDEIYSENLKDIISSKSKGIKAENDYEFKGKLIRFAMGRGYDYSDIIKVMPQLEMF